MDGVRVARKRVLRLMRENLLLSPHRARTRDGTPHDRNIITDGAEPDVGDRRECAAASGVRDGGWPPAIGLQEQVANRRKRRGSKARVVSVTEKASQRRQVGDRKANTSELPFKCRKCSDDVETGELMLRRDQSGRHLLTGQTTSGTEAARSCFRLLR